MIETGLDCISCGKPTRMAVDGAGIGTLWLCLPCRKVYHPQVDFWDNVNDSAAEYWEERYKEIDNEVDN